MKRGAGITHGWSAALVAWALTACGGGSGNGDVRVVETPAPPEYEAGQSLYNARCALCHGARGSGSPAGPPLVHRVYEPSHHADAAFQRAVAFGVRAHHWGFGDMPPIQGMAAAEVAGVIAYVRWLQREAGIR